MRPFTVRKPIESPSTAPARTSAMQLARPRHVGNEPSARTQPAHILVKLEPHADWLGRVVLEQHRHAADAAAFQRARERSRHYHVARRVDLAEQARIAFDGAVLLDARLRTEDL